MTFKTHCHPQIARTFLTLLLFLAASLAVMAQEDKSQYDMGTPPQHTAGVSAIGSYLSTDLGTVNLANGSLNFQVPIGQVGGRGFWLPITLNYSSKIWSSRTGQITVTDPTVRQYTTAIAVYDDLDAPRDYYQRVAPGWTIGAVPVLLARGLGIGDVDNPNGCQEYTRALVKLTLILPDKGEVELRDDATDGSPLGTDVSTDSGCSKMDGQRGRRWHAVDGSGTIFISDAENGVVNGNLNGVVVTSDGTRYRFDDTNPYFSDSVDLKEFARASSVTDRQGNRVQISYSTTQIPFSTTVQFTDQLGRISKIEFNAADPSDGTPLAVLVTVPGYNGQARYYKIKLGTMNQNYRSGINPVLPVINGDMSDIGDFDYSWQGPHTSLFAGSFGSEKERNDNRDVLTELVLPDARSLRFRYNEYGEVAEVEMPTGGKVRYDYAYSNALPTGNSPAFEVHPSPWGAGNVSDIDRAVVARRAYPDGATLEATWSYAYTVTTGGSGNTTNKYTDVQARSAGNVLMLNQRHYFLPQVQYRTKQGGTGYSLWSTGLESRTETRDAAGVVLAASEQDWSQRTPLVWTTTYPQEQPANDNRVNESRNILDDGKVARVTTAYEQNVKYNNPTEVAEYDFDGTLKRRKVTGYLTTNAVTGYDYRDDAIHLLSLPQQQAVYDEAGVERARTVYEYDNYISDSLHAPLQDYASVTGHDATYGAARLTRGNVTSTGSWLNTTNSYLYTYPRYDVVGNVVSVRDARGNVSTISYGDDFGDGSNPGGGASGSNGATYALPTLVTSAAPNAGEQPHTARSQYDFLTGLLTGFRDRNGVVSQTIYNDAFNRPTMVKSALGITGTESHARMYYAPQTVYGVTLINNDVLTATDLTSLDDGQLRSWTRTDGFGRTTEAWSKDPQGDVKSETVYDALGRAKQASNPYRPSQSESALYTTNVYDMLGRVTSVTTPDSAVISTSYSGNTVTVADQASKDRQSKTDALGRLIEVIEDPGTGGLNYQTTYGYDVLDDLLTVSQGSQTRSFSYDSLKRLTAATNPESGTISYQYDAASNLSQKTDARAVVTTYGYDSLNRAISRSYSDGTPSVTYTYDAAGVSNSKGRLTSISSSVSATNYTAYDALGRLTSNQQVTDSQTYSLSYSYNLAGHLTSETYPSGRVVATEYDGAGRIAGVRNQGSPNYYAGGSATDNANRIQYWAHGAVKQMRLGNGLIEQTVFNNRLQPQMIKLATSSNQSVEELHYYYGERDYNGAGQPLNNGNMLHHTTVVEGVARQQVYEYDSLNRLRKGNEQGGSNWQQVFTYDRYGNRNFDVGQTTANALGSNLSVDQTNNRYAAGQGSILYDNAGNLTRDFDGHIFAYDAENKQTSYDGGAAADGTDYRYDGDGRRVKKVVGIATTIFVYDAVGQLVAEYSTSTLQGSGGTSYLTSDTLGTPRVITDQSGQVKARHDYLPFGEELFAGVGGRTTAQGYSGNDSNRFKFAELQRDDETGLDYAQARYYSSSQGRFTSVDPLNASGKPGIPQSWNRYTYCLNSPLILVDPTGMIWGTQDFEQDGHKYRRFVWFEGNKVGKGFTAFTPAKDGSVIALKGGDAARLYRNGSYDYLPGPAKITISGQENLNAAAGNFDSSIPFGKQIREWALGGPGGVDTESPEYENASRIGEGVVQGSLFFAGGPLEGAAKEGAEGAAKVIEEAASVGRRFGPDQEALIQLAKEARRTGATPEQAKTLINWAKEYGVKPAQNHIGTDHWVGGDHIRIGPVNHIPVKSP